jgi:hypothetical protein
LEEIRQSFQIHTGLVSIVSVKRKDADEKDNIDFDAFIHIAAAH